MDSEQCEIEDDEVAQPEPQPVVVENVVGDYAQTPGLNLDLYGSMPPDNEPAARLQTDESVTVDQQ